MEVDHEGTCLTPEECQIVSFPSHYQYFVSLYY